TERGGANVNRKLVALGPALAALLVPAIALGQPAKGAGGAADDLLTRPVALVVALALVSLLPFAFMTLTAFVKISTVLQIVRCAISSKPTLPNASSIASSRSPKPLGPKPSAKTLVAPIW